MVIYLTNTSHICECVFEFHSFICLLLFITGMHRFFLLVYFFTLIACDSNEITESRSFYMGFTVDEQETLSTALVEDSEMVHYHFQGVPWTALQASDSIPQHLLDVWMLRRSMLPLAHKVYISASPLSAQWDALADDNSQKEVIQQTGATAFDDERIILAYFKYCKLMIDFFHPHFFNMAVDANLLFLSRPDHWQSFMKFQWSVYVQLKSAYPDLVIFTSVAAEPAIQSFVQNCDYILQRLPILQLIENSDLYSLTIHPKSVSRILNSYDRGEFSSLFQISKKPFALSLNGTTDHLFLNDLDQPTPANFEFSASLNQTLSACLKRRAVFMVRTLEAAEEVVSPHNSPDFKIESIGTTSALWRKYLSISVN